MVEYNEESVVITIDHPHPHEFIPGFQRGMLGLVQSFILASMQHEEVVLDDENKDGIIYAIEVVKATLPDPQTLEIAQQLATQGHAQAKGRVKV